MIIIRCDGSRAIGMGHVSRCLALADALRDDHRARVIFAMRDPQGAGAIAVKRQRYDVLPVTAGVDEDYGPWLQQLVGAHGARALVVDVRDHLSRAALDTIRASGVRVVTIDEGTERRLASDMAFYPPVPQVDEMDWRGFTGQRYAAWEWVVLRREFGLHDGTGVDNASSAPIDILVTMGGSDPAGMTEFTVRALNLLETPFAVRVVVGPAYDRVEPLIDAFVHSRHAVQIARAPEPLAPLMRASRIAIASFGVTAYELAACGVPSVHLCLTGDHARSSSAFQKAGIAITAGVFDRVRPHHLIEAVSRVMGNAGTRADMAARARQLVDGRGATRVAQLISERIAGG